MTKIELASYLSLTTLLLLGGAARAADAPQTADVLGKLHHSNQMEIEMGKLAQKNGQSKDVKDFGKTLVKDHSAADKKVTALAKKEKIDLAASTPAMKSDEVSKLPSGADFDPKFAQSMVEDHKKDIREATEARDGTADPQLKSLLTDIVPTLQKHEDMAQKIVDTEGKK
jgi:putative membrane protein